MSLLANLRKDFLQLARSRTSVLLILLMPLIATLILGNLFNERAASGVRILVCTGGTELGGAVHRALASGPFSVERGDGADCVSAGREMIANGKLAAVVGVAAGADSRIASGTGERMTVYYDNSADDTASFVLAYVSGAAGKISENISSSFISGAWAGLSSMGLELEISQVRLAEARGRISEVSLRMDSARSSLENLSIASVSEKIGEIDSFLSDQADSLADANSSIGAIGEKLGKANGTIGDSLSLLAEADDLLAEDINYTDAVLAAARSVDSALNSSFSDLCRFSSCPNESANFTSSLVAGLQERRDREERMRAQISAIRENLTLTRAELDGAAGNLTSGSEYLASISSKLGGARIAVSEMGDLLADFAGIRNSSLESLGSAKSAFGNITEEITATLPKIEEARKSLEEIYSRDPTGVVRPVYLSEERAFDSKGFTYIFPSVVAIVLMFNLMLLSANSIISERKGGTLLRAKLLSGETAGFVASKAIVFLAVGAVETVIMLSAGLLFFSLGIASPVGFALAVLASSAMFAAAGVTIGFLARDESSGLLAVVGLVVPSLFLAGGLVSFDFLPAGLRAISVSLPLSVSSSAVRSFSVYNTLPAAELATIAAYLLALGGLALFLSRRRLE